MKDDLTRRLRALTPEQREELLRRTRARSPVAQAPGQALVRRGAERAELSLAQERLWMIEQLAPGNVAYTISLWARFGGPLDAQVLRGALDALVARHEALRTVFRVEAGKPCQRIKPPEPFDFEQVDLSNLGAQERRPEAERRALAAGRRPFDFSEGPLARAVLYRLSEAEHLLLLAVHHIVCDGWSVTVLTRELAALYDAFASHQGDPLSPLPVQYADYAAWQREAQKSEQQADSLDYWSKRLAGAPTLELPTKGPRPEQPSMRGAVERAPLSPEAVEGLVALARAEKATPFMAFLAIFCALLQRYTGQQDLCIGTPVAGRGHPLLEGMVGFLVNTVVLRVDLTGRPSFRQLLRRVRDTAFEAYAHDAAPFAKVVQKLNPARDASRSALFQVMFNFDDRLDFGPPPKGLSAEWSIPGNGTEMFDLTIFAGESGGKTAFAVQYATDLFEPEAMRRFANHYRNLADAAVRAPDASLLTLPMLSDDEQRVRLDWNKTEGPFPEQALLHELFEERARQAPDAIAVAAAATKLTYGELSRESNRLARALREAGAQPNCLVPVVVEKGAAQVIAALGVLKSGGAYVPVDPRFPAERLAYLFDHSQARVAVTTSGLDQSLPWPKGLARVVLESTAVAAQSDAPVQSVQEATDLAYVIYTSGSTGMPKGVMIDHRGPVNTCLDLNERFRVGPLDRVLAVSSLGFDLSVYDLFGVLAAGGRVVIPAPYEVADPAAWAELLNREQVTIWNSVPALMQVMVDFASGRAGVLPPSLRLVFMSGDWIPLGLPDQIRALCPRAELISMGGATEASIWSILFPISAVDPGWKSIPYGRPMKNQRFWVLNEALEPCPVGVPGDLYIGGVGVAKGYWRDPEKTVNSFLAHPKSGERIYRTGDLGQYFPDGVIEFLGRKDFQVKVNGYRVELGEIEAALVSHAAVKTAVVSAVGARGEGFKLVAYVVPAPGTTVSHDQLRVHLQQKLPSYMVPALYFTLEALPLSPNGKVDRAALPKPGAAATERTYVAPKGPVEEQLAQIWAAVLGLERVGATENFFEIGGDSMLLIKSIGRAAEAGIGLTPQQMYLYPTIEALAQVVTEASLAPGAQTRCLLPLPSFPEGPRPSPDELLPTSYNEQRWYGVWKRFRNVFSGDFRILVGPLKVDRLAEAVQQALARHDLFWSQYVEVEGRLSKRIHAPRPVPVPVTDLSSLEPAEKRTEALYELIVRDIQHDVPDLCAPPPLFRAQIVKLAADRHALVAMIPHTMFDETSRIIFWEDVSAAYEALAAGAPPPPRNRHQYLDFARWQRELFESDRAHEAVELWRRRLSGATPTTRALPTDFPWQPVDARRRENYLAGFEYHRAVFGASLEDTKALIELGRAEQLPMSLVSMSAVAALLGRYAAPNDVLISTVTTVRARVPGLDTVTGCFSDNILFRIAARPSLSPREMMRRVRKEVSSVMELPYVPIVPVLFPQLDDHQRIVFDHESPSQFNLRVPRGLSLEGLDERLVYRRSGHKKAYLEIQAYTFMLPDGALGGVLLMNSELWKAETNQRWADEMKEILLHFAQRPDEPLRNR